MSNVTPIRGLNFINNLLESFPSLPEINVYFIKIMLQKAIYNLNLVINKFNSEIIYNNLSKVNTNSNQMFRALEDYK